MRRLIAVVLIGVLHGASLFAFGRDELLLRAQDLAASAYVAPVSRLPVSLRTLSYDEYRKIQFDPRRTLWADEGLPYRVQFFHPGFVHETTIQLFQLDGGAAVPVPFSSSYFRYVGDFKPDGLSQDLGFSGFRILHPLNDPARFDELIVFQGASYFRALGRGQRYGLSARGLAVDTAAVRPEEFPLFREYWLDRPTNESTGIVVHALMDSPSAVGVFSFEIQPGPATTLAIKATLIVRPGSQGKVFGLAPLTSMFWHGESSGTVNNDYRPEVHDSDGLLMHRGNGEWIWRPLSNPGRVRTVSFSDENPRGFGLVQRDRRFASYEDLEAHYHLRPSAWVEPIGSWGRGEVRLVEIPTGDETNDNIVAFWVSDKAPEPRKPLEYSYRIHWFMETEPGAIQPPAGKAVATRLGRSQTHEPDLQRFVVDFDLPGDRRGDDKVESELTVGPGASLVHRGLQRNPFNGTWRLAFSLRPDGTGRPVELRGYLREDSEALTETWTYLWQP